jgi:hypothetical protein
MTNKTPGPVRQHRAGRIVVAESISQAALLRR